MKKKKVNTVDIAQGEWRIDGSLTATLPRENLPYLACWSGFPCKIGLIWKPFEVSLFLTGTSFDVGALCHNDSCIFLLRALFKLLWVALKLLLQLSWRWWWWWFYDDNGNPMCWISTADDAIWESSSSSSSKASQTKTFNLS